MLCFFCCLALIFYFFLFLFVLFDWFSFFGLLHLVFQRALANTRAIKARAGKEHSVVSYHSSSCARRVLSWWSGWGGLGSSVTLSVSLCSASHQLLRIEKLSSPK